MHFLRKVFNSISMPIAVFVSINSSKQARVRVRLGVCVCVWRSWIFCVGISLVFEQKSIIIRQCIRNQRKSDRVKIQHNVIESTTDEMLLNNLDSICCCWCCWCCLPYYVRSARLMNLWLTYLLSSYTNTDGGVHTNNNNNNGYDETATQPAPTPAITMDYFGFDSWNFLFSLFALQLHKLHIRLTSPNNYYRSDFLIARTMVACRELF